MQFGLPIIPSSEKMDNTVYQTSSISNGLLIDILNSTEKKEYMELLQIFMATDIWFKVILLLQARKMRDLKIILNNYLNIQKEEYNTMFTCIWGDGLNKRDLVIYKPTYSTEDIDRFIALENQKK